MSPNFCFYGWTFVIELPSTKGLCWSKEDCAVSKWWEHHLTMISFISVLNSQSKSHKGVLLFWRKCVNLTKLFRWWETQLDQLWFPSWEICRSHSHVAYGKSPTWMAVVEQYLASHEDPSHYCISWADPSVWCSVSSASAWHICNNVILFPVKNCYNNNVVVVVCVCDTSWYELGTWFSGELSGAGLMSTQ